MLDIDLIRSTQFKWIFMCSVWFILWIHSYIFLDLSSDKVYSEKRSVSLFSPIMRLKDWFYEQNSLRNFIIKTSQSGDFQFKTQNFDAETRNSPIERASCTITRNKNQILKVKRWKFCIQMRWDILTSQIHKTKPEIRKLTISILSTRRISTSRLRILSILF